MKITPEIKQFLLGYISAIQNLVILYDQPSMAESILRESGWGKEYWIYAQKLSGNKSLVMNNVIKSAFK